MDPAVTAASADQLAVATAEFVAGRNPLVVQRVDGTVDMSEAVELRVVPDDLRLLADLDTSDGLCLDSQYTADLPQQITTAGGQLMTVGEHRSCVSTAEYTTQTCN